MFQFVAARPRLFAALLAGLCAYPAMPGAWHANTRALCAWDLGVVLYLLLTALLFFSEHGSRMADDARRQQEGEWTIFAITVAVVFASFYAIFSEFGVVKDLHGTAKLMRIGLVGLTLFASWVMLQTTFCFRYAHEFYTASSAAGHFDGGLEFPSDDRPDYLDFAYFAFVLGMTFQVSDVQITSKKLRRLATLHGLLSFLFNTVVIALTVNIGASLM